MEEIDKIQNMV